MFMILGWGPWQVSLRDDSNTGAQGHTESNVGHVMLDD